MFKPTRWLAAALVGALALTAIGAGVVSAKPGGKKDRGTIYAAITHQSANKKIDFIAGQGTDKLLGATAVTFSAKVTPGTPGTIPITVNPVVIYYKTGTLSGTSTVDLTVNANNTVTITKGKLTAKKGTGTLKGHSLVATVTGTGAGVAGPYVFNYTGTYK
ncbi:MAG: hypothetical protein ACR2L9_07285 [Solirubrobacteraceae bacterium]